MAHTLPLNEMNSNNGMRPVHPGEILREDFLIPLEMSAYAMTTRP